MKKKNYLIVGGGYMATHFSNYLNLEGITHKKWTREETNLNNLIDSADTVFLLITDGSIIKFIKKYPKIKEKTLIHFSGALNIKDVYGFHPLMSFKEKLYTLEEYREISFIGTEKLQTFRKLLPVLKNSYYQIKEEQKAYYHSLCVIGGNFSSILWEKVFRDFRQELKIPDSALKPYLKMIFNNILDNPTDSLTGPIKRRDKITIKKNKKSLNRTWSKIYSLFNRAYTKGI